MHLHMLCTFFLLKLKGCSKPFVYTGFCAHSISHHFTTCWTFSGPFEAAVAVDHAGAQQSSMAWEWEWSMLVHNSSYLLSFGCSVILSQDLTPDHTPKTWNIEFILHHFAFAIGSRVVQLCHSSRHSLPFFASILNPFRIYTKSISPPALQTFGVAAPCASWLWRFGATNLFQKQWWHAKTCETWGCWSALVPNNRCLQCLMECRSEGDTYIVTMIVHRVLLSYSMLVEGAKKGWRSYAVKWLFHLLRPVAKCEPFGGAAFGHGVRGCWLWGRVW